MGHKIIKIWKIAFYKKKFKKYFWWTLKTKLYTMKINMCARWVLDIKNNSAFVRITIEDKIMLEKIINGEMFKFLYALYCM
jgi:hypothetical protein